MYWQQHPLLVNYNCRHQLGKFISKKKKTAKPEIKLHLACLFIFLFLLNLGLHVFLQKFYTVLESIKGSFYELGEIAPSSTQGSPLIVQ